ncbi:MAG: hypothetical protein U5K27_09905 [Desulfotignum sp.]|nr:hypothetical protein [Desulfotignum sp.]
MKIVLDEEMMAHDLLNFHPLENTATTTIASEDLVKVSGTLRPDPADHPVVKTNNLKKTR